MHTREEYIHVQRLNVFFNSLLSDLVVITFFLFLFFFHFAHFCVKVFLPVNRGIPKTFNRVPVHVVPLISTQQKRETVALCKIISNHIIFEGFMED